MVKKGWKGIYADLKSEFIVAREYAPGKTVYERIHWSKIEVRDLGNLLAVYHPDKIVAMHNPTPQQLKRVSNLLAKITAMQEYMSENTSNRMRDMGLIEYHIRKRAEKLFK